MSERGLPGGGETLALAVVFGLASVPRTWLSFTPGGFSGDATAYSVHAADAAAFGVTRRFGRRRRRAVDVPRGDSRTHD